MECALRMQQENIVELTDVLALEAADVALERGLARISILFIRTERVFDDHTFPCLSMLHILAV